MTPQEIRLEPPRVFNVRAYSPGSLSIYIGRSMPAAGGRAILDASDWMNHHRIKTDTPEERRRAVRLYALDVLTCHLRLRLGDLAGLHLLCWCSPKLCHGDALVQLIAVTRFWRAKCPACGATVVSYLEWDEGLQVLSERWHCPDHPEEHRGESRRPMPDCLKPEPQPMLL